MKYTTTAIALLLALSASVALGDTLRCAVTWLTGATVRLRYNGNAANLRIEIL